MGRSWWRITMLVFLSAFATVTVAPPSWPDSGPDPVELVATTVAGTGEWGVDGDGGPAAQARLDHPGAVAVGPDGELYVANETTIRTVQPDGVITTLAGNGERGFSGDGGRAEDASFDAGTEPRLLPMAVDAAGTVYVADTNNERVRAVDPEGVVRTVAGGGALFDQTHSDGYGDGGPATDATLGRPSDVAVGPDGTVYIADSWDQRIRMVTPDGTIETLAAMDGQPTAIDISAEGVIVVLVTEDDGWSVQALGSRGEPLGHMAGNEASENALFTGHVTDIAVASDGDLYLVAADVHRLYALEFHGEVTGYWQREQPAFRDNSIENRRPFSVAVGPDDTVYVADPGNQRVRSIHASADYPAALSAKESITTLVGSGAAPPHGGSAEKLRPEWLSPGWFAGGLDRLDVDLDQPWAIDVGPTGEIYLVDGRNRLFVINERGVVRLAADLRYEIGWQSPPRNGPLGGLAIGADGTIYVADSHNQSVIEVDPHSGSVVSRAFTVEGVGYGRPAGLAVGADGALYVAVPEHRQVCQIARGADTCRPVIVGATNGPYDPDLGEPWDVAVGVDGVVYIADPAMARIRAYDPTTGALTVVAGDGGRGVPAGGSALDTSIGIPVALAMDPSGRLVVADAGHHRVYAVDLKEETVGTIAGHGETNALELREQATAPSFQPSTDADAGDDDVGDGGLASAATLDLPRDVAVAPDGSVLIADTGNHRVRVVGADSVPASLAGGKRIVLLGGLVLTGVGVGAVAGGRLFWLHRSAR